MKESAKSLSLPVFVVLLLAMAAPPAYGQKLGKFQQEYAQDKKDKDDDDDDDEDDDDDDGGIIGDIFGELFDSGIEQIGDMLVPDYAVCYARYPYFHGHPGWPIVGDSSANGEGFSRISTSYLKESDEVFAGNLSLTAHAGQLGNMTVDLLRFHEDLPPGDPEAPTDTLNVWGLSWNFQPIVGENGYFELGFGLKGLRGSQVDTSGPLFRAGIVLYPGSPLSARASWEETSLEGTGMTDYSLGMGVLLGPGELDIGWRGVKTEGGQWLDGPTIGLAIYF